MQAHVGMDAEPGLADRLVATATNFYELTRVNGRHHCEPTTAVGDVGFCGVDQCDAAQGGLL